MTLIKLNDGDSITVQMNFDKSEKPYSIVIIRRGSFMSLREFGDSREGVFDTNIKKKVKYFCGGCNQVHEDCDYDPTVDKLLDTSSTENGGKE